MSEAANVPDRLFVVARDESSGATENGYALPYMAFWRKEGAFAWLRGQEGDWAVTEVPIYPAFPSGPWHAQVPVEAVVLAKSPAPTAALIIRNEAGTPLVQCLSCGGSGHVYSSAGTYGCEPCKGMGMVEKPPRATGDDGDEPALAARAREGGNG